MDFVSNDDYIESLDRAGSGRVTDYTENGPGEFGQLTSLRVGRVGEKATPVARPTLPSSNRRCRFPASGSPESSRLRHAQCPIDGSAPSAPNAEAIVLLADDGMASGCAVANAGSDGPERSVRSHSK